MNWKIVYLEKVGKITTLFILKKRVGKCSNTFDQLLRYWKIPVSSYDPQVYKV